MTRIKLCGLSRIRDIEAANALAPDYVGFVFAENSRRYVTPEQAAALIAPGDRIFAGGAGSFPAVLIDAVSDRAELRGIPVVTVVNGTESRALSDPACFARTPYHSLFLGRADRKFQQRGGLHENSVQFHQTMRAAREVYRVTVSYTHLTLPTIA